ncbi:MAG TPA: PilZ domain-containing protein [Acidobacteriota bacterium]|jgi:hypothetical protein
MLLPKNSKSSSNGIENGERRQHQRIYMPFPAKVRAIGLSGEPFHVDTVLDNISAGGVYIRLAQPVKLGERVFVVVRLSTGRKKNERVPRLAMLGTAVRVERQAGGRCGVAVASTGTRFL